MPPRPLASAAIVLLGGCSLRASNPTVTLVSADLSPAAASLTLHIENPNEGSLTLSRIDYTLTDRAFPIARGSSPASAKVPGRGAVDVPLRIAIDPPLDATPGAVDLRGTLRFRSGPLGFAEVTSSAFVASWPGQ